MKLSDRYLIIGSNPTPTNLFPNTSIVEFAYVKVNDEYVSNNHMIAHLKPDYTIWIVDMGSMNGTWIIDQVNLVLPIRVHGFTQLKAYQSVKIGHTIIPHGSPGMLDMLL